MAEVFISIYIMWAVFCGCEFLNGRVEFLERDGLFYKILKFICACAVGMVYGVIYFFILFLNFIGILEKEL